MRENRRSICIIAFSPVARDSRVLRQIQYLSPHYDLTIIGQGNAHPSWKNSTRITWVPTVPIINERSTRRLIEKVIGLFMLMAGRLHSAAFDYWYWRQPIMKDTLAKAIASERDAYHANDWNTLPIAVEAARRMNACVVFDAHEYAPLELENRRIWRLAYSSMIEHILRRYALDADVSITVAPAIAERYRREFKMDPAVILNAPSFRAVPPSRDTNFDQVKLIHHGAAIPDRRLEVMIMALAQCHRRFTLHFMLTAIDPAYITRLETLAGELTPGRVFFHNPVAPEEVVEELSVYDIGFCYIAPTNYNYLVSLPNKFFDFIAAGLPVCIGPSPSMAEIVKLYRLGWIAPSFKPEALAAVLNSLSAEHLVSMQHGARAAARQINAEREMGKLIKIYESLFKEQP